MSHEVRIDRVPTAEASPSPLMHPASHLGLPAIAPMVPSAVLPAAAVLPTALSMHSPHLLAQMSHFLMSLREHQHKLRQEAEEDRESTASNNSNNVKLNNNEPQPLDLRMDSKKVTLKEDENRNLIDVVSMDEETNEEDLEDLEAEESEECENERPPSVQNELLAAHSAILSRFQNLSASNIPPEAMEQVQRTLKQMLAHASAKQSRAQQAAAQNSHGKMER